MSIEKNNYNSQIEKVDISKEHNLYLAKALKKINSSNSEYDSITEKYNKKVEEIDNKANQKLKDIIGETRNKLWIKLVIPNDNFTPWILNWKDEWMDDGYTYWVWVEIKANNYYWRIELSSYTRNPEYHVYAGDLSWETLKYDWSSPSSRVDKLTVGWWKIDSYNITDDLTVQVKKWGWMEFYGNYTGENIQNSRHKFWYENWIGGANYTVHAPYEKNRVGVYVEWEVDAQYNLINTKHINTYLEWKVSWQLWTLDYKFDARMGWGVDLGTTIKNIYVWLNAKWWVWYTKEHSYYSDTINYWVNNWEYVYGKIWVNVWNAEVFAAYQQYNVKNKAGNKGYGEIWVDFKF